MKRRRRILLACIAGLFALCLLPFGYARLTQTPSADRDWVPEQKIPATIQVSGDTVVIDRLRNFAWHPGGRFEERYERRTYDLRKLDSAWFVVERFGTLPGLAHTMLSFGFGDDYVAISVEVRKERGEEYSPLLGMLRRFELLYVVADERDAIGLRTNVRRDPVYLYPAVATREQIRTLFLGMAARSNELAGAPEFYDTITNNCTTNIVAHVNAIAPRIPFSYKVLFPAYSDELAYDLALISTDRPFAEVQAAHRIDLRAQAHGVGDDFSRVIRDFAANRPAP
jgi:hypothetical protein